MEYTLLYVVNNTLCLLKKTIRVYSVEALLFYTRRFNTSSLFDTPERTANMPFIFMLVYIGLTMSAC